MAASTPSIAARWTRLPKGTRGGVPLQRRDQQRQRRGQQHPHLHRNVVGAVDRRGHRQPGHPGEDQREQDEPIFVHGDIAENSALE